MGSAVSAPGGEEVLATGAALVSALTGESLSVVARPSGSFLGGDVVADSSREDEVGENRGGGQDRGGGQEQGGRRRGGGRQGDHRRDEDCSVEEALEHHLHVGKLDARGAPLARRHVGTTCTSARFMVPHDLDSAVISLKLNCVLVRSRGGLRNLGECPTDIAATRPMHEGFAEETPCIGIFARPEEERRKSVRRMISSCWTTAARQHSGARIVQKHNLVKNICPNRSHHHRMEDVFAAMLSEIVVVSRP